MTDTQGLKRGERRGLDTPVVHALNDVYQVLGVSTLSEPFKKANALSTPPGKYDRKIKTQRNRRGPAQVEDHAV